jgi:hypothetical protein
VRKEKLLAKLQLFLVLPEATLALVSNGRMLLTEGTNSLLPQIPELEGAMR